MRKRGFTLIELLIVLAILGILVGVVAMSVGGLNDTAVKRGLQSEWTVVQTSMDAYNTQDVIVDGSAAITAPTTWEQIDSESGAFTKYLKLDTKYYFTWAAEGITMTVRDRQADGEWSFSYDGSDIVEQ